MPTIEWNQRWKRDLVQWVGAEPAAPFGNQWGDPEEVDWLRTVRDRFVLPFVDRRATALEIGSGGGRWTQYLLDFERLYCVDIHPEMFHYLLERFGPRPNLGFCRSNGTDFPGVPAGSVDFVFTFGTFVHLDPPLIHAYLENLAPLLRPYAHVVLQYADKAKPQAAANQGFAPTTAAVMHELLASAGYAVEDEDDASLPHSNVLRARIVRD